jgi:hypothetical protein
MPSEKAYEKLMGLLQGFWLDVDEDGIPALLIKLEASLIASIINGVPFDIIIRNPNITQRSCTLYIYDIDKNPFYITGSVFGEEHESFLGFDKAAVALAGADSVTVILYNELSHPVFTIRLNINIGNSFDKWLFNVYNNNEYKSIPPVEGDGYYFPESDMKGFKVSFINIDNSKTDKVTIIAPLYIEEWRSGTVADIESFNYNNYDGDGKHGYLQELSIANNLSKIFIPNVDFYLSPKNKDGKEFADFIIVKDEYLILIESKYILSNKQTNKHGAIVKAVNQLKKAEGSIVSGELDLENEELLDRLKNIRYVVKYCLLNDRIILSDENSGAIVRMFNKSELPIFTSVTSFFQMAVSIKLKNEKYFMQSLIATSLSLYSQYLKSSDKIMYVRDFSMKKASVKRDEDGKIDLSQFLSF